MIVIADQKRRVLLPKSVKPGDAFECIQSGDKITMVRLQVPTRFIPPVSEKPLDPQLLKGIDLEEPAWDPLQDEGIN